MADNDPNPEQDTQAKPPKSSAVKTLIVLGVVLLLEGGTIGVTMYMAQGPQVAGAGITEDLEAAMQNKMELHVVTDRFPNLLTGRQISYDTQVYISVRQIDNENDEITLKIESMQAQIQMDVATIIKKAQPAYFKEPTLATLCRQIQAALDERLGVNEEGNSYIDKVLIPKCNGFRADF